MLETRCNALLALSQILAAGYAMADGSSAKLFSYDGFGTAGIARSNTNRAEYVTSNQLAGATENLDYKTDSKLGIQGTFRPTNWLSATVEALAKERDSARISTQLEWAYLALRPTSGFLIRYGKLALPTFLVSDFRDVGFANTWLRAPNSVYGEAIYHVFQGGDITYRQPLGEHSLTLNVLVGAPDSVNQLSAPGVADHFTGHHMSGYSLTADLGPVTLRTSILEMTFRRYIKDRPLEEGLYDFYDLGIVYDRNDVVAQGEFIELRTGDPDDNVNGWYVMGGYRLGKWLPYAIYAANHKNEAANGAIPELNASTVSLGVRLDLFRSVDLKAQIDRVKGFDYGTPFINERPGFNNEATIFSLVTDFVF